MLIKIYGNFSQPARKPGRQPGRKLFSQVIWLDAPWCSAATANISGCKDKGVDLKAKIKVKNLILS